MIMKIKKATKKDKFFILSVRNQNISRKFSSNKKKITSKEHNKWFQNNFLNKNFFIFIVFIKHKRIGYVRIEKFNSKYFVSISILKKWQNLGLSKMALRHCEIKVQKKTNNLYAKVNKYNKKSLSLFNGLNYKILTIKNNIFIMKKKIVNYNYIKLVNKIEKIRKKNNNNWMDILKIAFQFAPERTSKIMSQIYKEDSKISKITKKFSKN